MEGNSSLHLLIEINQAERQLQLAHFDSLDTKAGLVLGFAGVLIALGNGPGTLAGTASTILAALAAVASVASFGRGSSHPSIRFASATYAGAELEFTHLTVLDTLEVMLVETTEMLELKSHRLKLALAALTAGAVLASLDLLIGLSRWPKPHERRRRNHLLGHRDSQIRS